MTELLEAVLRGLGTGSIYALLALGFVIIYKATGVISFAQPALMLAGATIASYVAPAIGIVAFASLSFFVSVAIAALCTAPWRWSSSGSRSGRWSAGRCSWSRSSPSASTSSSGSWPAASSGSGARPIPDPWGLERVDHRSA